MKTFILLLGALLTLRVFASENESILPPEEEKSTFEMQISPVDAYERTQAVLKYYGVPADEEPGPYLADLQGQQSAANIQKNLKFLDPMRIFSRFSTVSPQRLSVFQDIDGRRVDDFAVNLGPVFAPRRAFRFEELPVVDPQKPLTGLRVALDPGHMGGSVWDKRTGKYVRDARGRIVSEGVIAYQVAVLLKADLEALGATVLITRNGLNPTTTLDYSTFDLKPFARNELKDLSLSPWFQRLLNAGPPGPALFNAFDGSAERKRLFSDFERGPYFIERADLWARAAMINAFQADIVLIIHFDTAEPLRDPVGVNPGAPNATKTFVVGAYQSAELSSRSTRKYFARHLLDQRSWDLSLALGRSVLRQFQSRLGLKIAASGGDKAVQVEPGIFARNLQIPRRLTAPAISYLECLFYNRPQEFNAFANATHPLLIDGKNIPYSDRVVDVKSAIREGVLEFVRLARANSQGARASGESGWTSVQF